MEDLNILKLFFLYSTIINTIFYVISSMSFIMYKECIIKIQRKFINIKAKDIERFYYKILGIYKILIIVLNLVPYIAICLID